MPIKKKVIEIYDKNKGQWVKAVIDGNVDPDKSLYKMRWSLALQLLKRINVGICLVYTKIKYILRLTYLIFNKIKYYLLRLSKRLEK